MTPHVSSLCSVLCSGGRAGARPALSDWREVWACAGSGVSSWWPSVTRVRGPSLPPWQQPSRVWTSTPTVPPSPRLTATPSVRAVPRLVSKASTWSATQIPQHLLTLSSHQSCGNCEGLTPAPSNTCYDRFSNCASLAETSCYKEKYKTDCCISCGLGEGMTPAASNTCYDTYGNCADLCPWYGDLCKKSCSAQCWALLLCTLHSSRDNE